MHSGIHQIYALTPSEAGPHHLSLLAAGTGRAAGSYSDCSENVPGLTGNYNNFMIHFRHHAELYNQQQKEQTDKTTQLQQELLRLQIADARNAATKNKKEAKTTQQMVATTPAPNDSTPTPAPTPAPAPPPVNVLYMTPPPYLGHFQNRGTGRGRGRGQDRRSRGAGGNQGDQRQFNGQCHNCGQWGHMARACRAPRNNSQGNQSTNQRHPDNSTSPPWPGNQGGQYYGGYDQEY